MLDFLSLKMVPHAVPLTYCLYLELLVLSPLLPKEDGMIGRCHHAQFCAVLEMESRVLCMLGVVPTGVSADLYSQLSGSGFFRNVKT